MPDLQHGDLTCNGTVAVGCCFGLPKQGHTFLRRYIQTKSISSSTCEQYFDKCRGVHLKLGTLHLVSVLWLLSHGC